nr:UPF0149 family protein [Arsenophonus endosymbiont of Bemisia tabaci]
MFNLLLPKNDKVSERADALAGWVNHFLLGLGITQPQLIEKRIKRNCYGFTQYWYVGLSQNDDQNELEQPLEEIIEYVKVAV